MARLGRFGFLATAIVFHLIYSCSIFDIYFVSPIVHGMQSHSVPRAPEDQAPAQRLVLFVGDGLRADKAFQSFPDPSPGAASESEPRSLAPFLRSKVLNDGTFGVSHTRVPTESRPGHVALIAGLYEDVSAVMTGWKLNPVNFDSVFNRSRHTWSWGSPDILPMFQEGAVAGRVDAACYGEAEEDFTKNALELDTWVFDRVKQLFSSATANHTLEQELKQDQNVFFLHLLGLDTTGHAFRPYSREYLHNIQVVDHGVEEIVRLIDHFYGDGRTAYVFTADHGMSDMGSHGDGHPDNTRTPLIAWGSGIAKPVLAKSGVAAGHEDGLSADWGLDHVQRNDVAQADVAALMAYLAGLAFPTNSVGELPLAYLSANVRVKAMAKIANARAVLEMFSVKETQKRAHELRYQPYPPFKERSIESRLVDIEEAMQASLYNDAVAQSEELLHLGLSGLRYLQTYDWLFLRVLITVGYIGWMMFAITQILDLYVLQGHTTSSRSLLSTAIFGGIGTILFTNLFLRHVSVYYYAYATFPVLFWEEVYVRRKTLIIGVRVLFKDAPLLPTAAKSLAYIAVLEALVSCWTSEND